MKEDIRVHMPYEVFKNLLMRAGRIKREEGKQIIIPLRLQKSNGGK